MRTYNLFRRKLSPDLACAVPEDHPVPAFIKSGWEFAGRVGDMRRAACRFNHEAADVSVQFNGFYLFQLIAPCHEHVFASRGREQVAGGGSGSEKARTRIDRSVSAVPARVIPRLHSSPKHR
jgi:hypothetical protein